MKRNIILITMIPIWSMNNGSGGKALFNTISAYLDKGYEIFLITNQKNDYENIKNMKQENIFYINTEWYERYRKKQHPSKFMTYKYFKEFERKSYHYICSVLDKIKEQKKVIYAYEVNAVSSAKKAAKKYNVPLVTRFQGTIMSQYKNNFYYKIRKYPHIQALSTKSDLAIMTDDGTQGDKVLDNYNNNSPRLFIRNGVNILDRQVEKVNKEELRKTLNIPNDKTILLTVSRLESWKRVDRAILALSKLKNREDYFLIIIGEGAEREKLENIVKKLNLNDNVKFMGAVKNSEVNIYMQLADIFLSFYDLSNVGNPLLEALCLGKPIITYDVGDTNKVINENNGILLQDVSPQNIARNIEKINDKKILEKYSKNAYEYANKYLYSWKKRMEIEIAEVDKLFDKEV